MKAEDLLKQEVITEKELMDYFDVESIEEIESILKTKLLSSLQLKEGVLYAGLKEIYDRLKETNYNTVQEELMFYAIILVGMYDFSFEEFSLYTEALGTFKLIFILSNEIGEQREVLYFRELYTKYIERQSNIGLIASDFLGKLSELLEDTLEGMDDEKIEEMREEAIKGLNSIKEKL